MLPDEETPVGGDCEDAVTAGTVAYALTSDGKVYSWAFDTSGCALGNGTGASVTPIAVTMTGALAGKTVTPRRLTYSSLP